MGSTKTRKTLAQGLTCLEICAGGGGAAIGLEQAGFSPVALLDNDPHSCATLRHNRPYRNVVEVDIQRFDASYWRGVDLLSGGLPCPPFSIAGKQLGREDDRDLFPAMLKIVSMVRPRAVLIENVRGILAPRFTPFRERVDAALSTAGFDTPWASFDGADFGVPQKRSRAFLVALRRDCTNPLRWPTPSPGVSPTVATAIGDLMAECGWKGVPDWM